MYESPIELVSHAITQELNKQTDEAVCRAVQRIGVNINKDELIKALQYDRQQYEKGYADAVEKVASILAVMLDTPCNFSPTDEWLAYVCDYKYSCDCEYKECWKQLFKHWDERKCGDAE